MDKGGPVGSLAAAQTPCRWEGLEGATEEAVEVVAMVHLPLPRTAATESHDVGALHLLHSLQCHLSHSWLLV